MFVHQGITDPNDIVQTVGTFKNAKDPRLHALALELCKLGSCHFHVCTLLNALPIDTIQ